MSFIRSIVKSVQRGVINVTSDGSDAGQSTATQAITGVNVASSIIRCTGMVSNLNVTDSSCVASINLSASTQVQAIIFNGPAGGTVSIAYEVVEYYPLFVKSRQTGAVTIPNSLSQQDSGISAVVVAKSICSYQGQFWNTDGVGAGMTPRNWLGSVELTSTTTVTGFRGNNQGSLVVPFTVLEFY